MGVPKFEKKKKNAEIILNSSKKLYGPRTPNSDLFRVFFDKNVIKRVRYGYFKLQID